MTESESKLFKDIKVGDKVTIFSNYGKPSRICIVEKLLKKYFVASGTKFNYEGYTVPYSAWNTTSCSPWRQEDSDYILKVNTRAKLKELFEAEIKYLTLEEIISIVNMLKTTKHYTSVMSDYIENLK